ncbi:helix-turn-helix transcriptional regulator [Citrobacter freundii]|nr:helix-turn-helix transcriptional regulator [Citrobacter freundii]
MKSFNSLILNAKKFLNDQNYRVLALCMLCGSPGTSAGELARVTGLSPSATSQHLARMREEGLIESQRDAQRILYSIKNAAVNSLIATLKTLYCP